MDEAKAIINVKEGIIELQGPVDFVRHYLDRYQSAIKELQGLTTLGEAAKEKIEPAPEKESVATVIRAEKGRLTCIGSIRDNIKSGFFNERRSVADVKKHLNEGELLCGDKAVRAGLTRLAKTGILNKTGEGRGLRYSRPE
jgi:hypothetical protein